LSINRPSNTSEPISLQRDLLKYATDGKSYYDSVFQMTGLDRDSDLSYWKDSTIQDPVTGYSSSPASFVQNFFIVAIQIAKKDPASLVNDPDLEYLANVAISPVFPNAIFDLVKVFQSYYERLVASRSSQMRSIGVSAAVSPAILFLLFFLPSYRYLSHEINAAVQLYARIPRKIAKVLEVEMKETLKEQMEMDGYELSEIGQADYDEAKDEPDGNGDASGVSMSSTTQRHSEPRQLLLASFAVLVFLISVVLGLSLTFTIPIDTMATRASMINYSGLRLSLMVQGRIQMHELALLANEHPKARLLRELMLDNVRLLEGLHEGVLFGSEEFNLQKTVGKVRGYLSDMK
jgi:hypothetical protein